MYRGDRGGIVSLELRAEQTAVGGLRNEGETGPPGRQIHSEGSGHVAESRAGRMTSASCGTIIGNDLGAIGTLGVQRRQALLGIPSDTFHGVQREGDTCEGPAGLLHDLCSALPLTTSPQFHLSFVWGHVSLSASGNPGRAGTAVL